ncbi:hypothetical protein IC582_020785 [Cucumis melo]
MARSMLQMKGLSNHFWVEVVSTSIYLLNISPTKANMNKTPFEAWYGKKAQCKSFKSFWLYFLCFGTLSSSSKTYIKSEKYIFVGYYTQSKAYRLYNPLNGKIFTRRDVVFDESASWDWQNDEEYISLVDGELTNDGEQTAVESSMETPTSTPPSSALSTPQSYQSPSSNDETSDELPSQRFRSMEDIYNSSQFALMVSNLVCYDEAASKEEWQQAMKEEMTAIEKNETWKMVDLSEEKNAIGLKWVYKTKFSANGSLEHKVRLVEKGYAHQHGIDFEETFSSIARFKTVRIVLELPAQQQWSVYQFDVKSAFLNGELQEEVYVEQPEGFVKKDSGEKVYKFTKALYGLKQAPWACYNKIDGYFQQNGFKRSN